MPRIEINRRQYQIQQQQPEMSLAEVQAQLADGEAIARIEGARGKNLFECKLARITKETPSGAIELFELATRYRNVIWLKRGMLVVVSMRDGKDPAVAVEGDVQTTRGKVAGQIVRVPTWKRQAQEEFDRLLSTSTKGEGKELKVEQELEVEEEEEEEEDPWTIESNPNRRSPIDDDEEPSSDEETDEEVDGNTSSPIISR